MGQIMPFPSRSRPDNRGELATILANLSAETSEVACNLLYCRAVLVRSRVLPDAQEDLRRTADTARRLDERLSRLRETLAHQDPLRLADLMLELAGEVGDLEREASRTMARITARMEAWTAVLG